MEYKLYLVGGTIRDEFLGLKSNDIDYSVVIESNKSMEDVYDEFVQQLIKEGFDIKDEKPGVVTVRALFPKNHEYSGVADFVLARKELYYPETGRTPVCKLGTLHDDLLRRDFTLNAMAKGSDGLLVDPFDGYIDLMQRVLRTPLDPIVSFRNDPLRIIRAMRFCITKGFHLSTEVKDAIKKIGLQGIEKVSVERVKGELDKCFKFDTIKTLNYLLYMRDTLNFDLIEYAFGGTGLKITTTNKK